MYQLFLSNFSSLDFFLFYIRDFSLQTYMFLVLFYKIQYSKKYFLAFCFLPTYFYHIALTSFIVKYYLCRSALYIVKSVFLFLSLFFRNQIKWAIVSVEFLKVLVDILVLLGPVNIIHGIYKIRFIKIILIYEFLIGTFSKIFICVRLFLIFQI